MDILHWILLIDEQFFIFLNQLPHPVWLNYFFLFFSFYPLIVWIVIAAIVIFVEEHYDRWFFPKILFALLIAGFIASGIVKPLVKRPRPDLTLGSEVTLIAEKPAAIPWNNDYAFPSGHAAVAFAGAYVLARERKKSRRKLNPQFKYVFVLIACLTAYSRIYLGKHYPLDTIFGAAIGWSVGWVVYNINQIKYVLLRAVND